MRAGLALKQYYTIFEDLTLPIVNTSWDKTNTTLLKIHVENCTFKAKWPIMVIFLEKFKQVGLQIAVYT